LQKIIVRITQRLQTAKVSNDIEFMSRDEENKLKLSLEYFLYLFSTIFLFFFTLNSMSMNKPPSDYNYNHATSSSKNSSNGMPFAANRPLPFLCHESAMNQRGHNHIINNQSTCCPQQPLLSNEHIYNEYEPYQHRPYNPR
jgi:hypothetical protein